MYSTILKNAHDHNEDHIMGERDNHIAICISLSPGEDYSRMAMVSRSLMERCSSEERWWSAAARRGGDGSSRRGGTGSPWRGCGGSPAAAAAAARRRRRQPGGGGPWPPFKLVDGAGMAEGFHLTAAALE